MADPSHQALIEATQQRAAALFGNGAVDQATELYQQILSLDPAHLEALRFIGRTSLQQHNYAKAASHFELAIKQQPNHDGMLFNTAMAYYGLKNLPEALVKLERCLQLNPGHLLALLYKGVVQEQLAQTTAAVTTFFHAIKLADSVADEMLMAETRKLLTHASRAVRQSLDIELTAALQPICDRYGADSIARIRISADIFVGKVEADNLHPRWNPKLLYIPGLNPMPFFEREMFPWLAPLEAATSIIRDELMQVLANHSGFAPYVDLEPGTQEANVWQALNRNDAWSSFHFYRHGSEVEDNCRRCPQTAAILRKMDLMRIPGYAPEVMFSVLKPHTRIQPHFGSVNGRLVVHLPLIVPPHCGALRVMDEARGWTEGQCLIFDDAFEHEAWNESDQTRVVLILDIWNPQLSGPEREAFSILLQAAQHFERQHEAGGYQQFRAV